MVHGHVLEGGRNCQKHCHSIFDICHNSFGSVVDGDISLRFILLQLHSSGVSFERCQLSIQVDLVHAFIVIYKMHNCCHRRMYTQNLFSTNQKKGGLESFPEANLSLITDNRQQVEYSI